MTVRTCLLFMIAPAAGVVAPTPSATQDAAGQIAFAVMPIPEAHQAAATVLGYQGGELVTLRAGTGDFTCLADQPGDERFQVACYHNSLAPYMARGRELRAEGITGQASIQQRWAEIESGALAMPRHPAALYQVFGDAATAQPGVMEGMGRLTVIYMAYATAEETGLSATPVPGMPWMMYSGRPTAHMMIPQ